MKGALVLCVISALLPGLHGLKCAQCLIGNSTCTTCDNADQICIAIQAVSPTAQPNGMYKGCIASAQCKPLSVSLSTSSDRHFQSTTACCDSNECNANLTISALPTGFFQNGVSCPMCEKQNGPNCESTGYLNCTGLEEKCITLVGSSIAGNGQNFSLKGCASRNACDMLVNDSIAFKGVIYKLDANAACTDSATLAEPTTEPPTTVKGQGSAPSTPAAILLPAMIGYLVVNVLPDL